MPWFRRVSGGSSRGAGATRCGEVPPSGRQRALAGTHDASHQHTRGGERIERSRMSMIKMHVPRVEESFPRRTGKDLTSHVDELLLARRRHRITYKEDEPVPYKLKPNRTRSATSVRRGVDTDRGKFSSRYGLVWYSIVEGFPL